MLFKNIICFGLNFAYTLLLCNVTSLIWQHAGTHNDMWRKLLIQSSDKQICSHGDMRDFLGILVVVGIITSIRY